MCTYTYVYMYSHSERDQLKASGQEMLPGGNEDLMCECLYTSRLLFKSACAVRVHTSCLKRLLFRCWILHVFMHLIFISTWKRFVAVLDQRPSLASSAHLGRGMCCNGMCICETNEDGYLYRDDNQSTISDCDCEPAEVVCQPVSPPLYMYIFIASVPWFSFRGLHTQSEVVSGLVLYCVALFFFLYE